MTTNQEKLDQTFNRLLELAVHEDEDLDPNKRCAVITIALAILVCPEKVILSNFLWLRLKYDCVEIVLSRKNEDTHVLFSSLLVEYDENKKIVGDIRQLTDLAEKYSDHTNNMKCIKHLKEYLPMAKDTASKAAVLGMAWAILQREEVSVCYHVSPGPDCGNWQTIPSMGISLQIDGGKIVSSSFPWLKQSALNI